MSQSVGSSVVREVAGGVFACDPLLLPKPEPGAQGVVIRERGTGAVIFVGWVPRDRWEAMGLAHSWEYFDLWGDPIEPAQTSSRPQLVK
jgi:hypothetical protein